MKFLIDNQLSPKVALILRSDGFDTVHVGEYDLGTAKDSVIFERAMDEDRIIVSADTDFGQILALRNTSKPSLILFRWPGLRHAQDQVDVILKTLPAVMDDLTDGCVVVIEEKRIRVRQLPIFGRE